MNVEPLIFSPYATASESVFIEWQTVDPITGVRIIQFRFGEDNSDWSTIRYWQVVYTPISVTINPDNSVTLVTEMKIINFNVYKRVYLNGFFLHMTGTLAGYPAWNLYRWSSDGHNIPDVYGFNHVIVNNPGDAGANGTNPTATYTMQTNGNPTQISVTIPPNTTNTQTTFDLRVDYPNGDSGSYNIKTGLYITNPLPPLYRPQAIKLNTTWRGCNRSGGIKHIKLNGNWIETKTHTGNLNLNAGRGKNRNPSINLGIGETLTHYNQRLYPN